MDLPLPFPTAGNPWNVDELAGAKAKGKMMVPNWLHILSIVALAGGFICASVIASDEFRQPRHMWIMNVVWPMVALFGTILTLWAYFQYGKLATHGKAKEAKQRGQKLTLYPVMVGKAAATAAAAVVSGTFARNGWPLQCPASPSRSAGALCSEKRLTLSGFSILSSPSCSGSSSSISR